MPTRGWGFGIGALLVVGGLGAWALLSRADDTPALETIGFAAASPALSAPALCPWRDPKRDLQTFFPGADGYQTRSRALSGLRLPLQRRLGSDTPLQENVLTYYSVFRGATPCGTVLTRRLAGDYGAIEIVVGLDKNQKIVGMRLQRLREPENVATALVSPAWLSTFQGKTADDVWQLGQDIPTVPAAAQPSAERIVAAVRSLLIEYEVSAAAGGVEHAGHHGEGK